MADKMKDGAFKMLRHRRTFLIVVAVVLISIIYLGIEMFPNTLERYRDYIHIESNGVGEIPSSEVDGTELEQTSFKHLKKLCRKTKWTDGLWLHCHTYCGKKKLSACGGLNNVRNRLQTCVRLAIDAGAGVILPSITWRNEDDLANTDGHFTTCADKFWNMEYFQESLANGCPQLQVRLCGDRSGIEHVIPTRERNYAQASYAKGAFRSFVEIAMEIAGLARKDINKAIPAVISYGDSFMAWNYNASQELGTIRKDLYKTIKYSQPLLDLSLQLYESPALRDGKFIGVHLRGESDWPDEFGSAADQMRLYTNEMLTIKESHNIKTIYVSCGDQEAINHFRRDLKPLGFQVVEKTSLLQNWDDAPTLAKLDELGFDQKAIVEYEILVRSAFFLGPVMSTMSSLIAFARTLNEREDFFEKYIFPGSWNAGMYREYPMIEMKGSEMTKLMVVSGVDVMNYFP